MENLNYKNENIDRERKNTWYDWSINYIPDPIRKIAGGFKDRVVSVFKHIRLHSKKTVHRRGKNQKHKNNLKKT